MEYRSIILLLIGLTVCQLTAAQNCTGTFGTRFLQNPTNCNQFHVCNNGVYVQSMNCAAGLHLNEDRQQCDVPANVDCPTTICPDTAAPTNVEMVGSTTNCQRFFICTGNAEPIVTTCGFTAWFDPATSSCVLNENGQCPIVTPQQPPPPTVWTTFCPAGFTGMVPNPTSCYWYFFCHNGVAQIFSCPANMVFDITTSQCSNTGGTCVEDAPPPSCPSPTGIVNVAHPHSCNMFYMCINGVPFKQECAPTLIFDTNENRCAPVESAVCNVFG